MFIGDGAENSAFDLKPATPPGKVDPVLGPGGITALSPGVRSGGLRSAVAHAVPMCGG